MTPTGWMTRVREVFDGAVNLPAGERDAYIEAACGNDERLKREVIELLAMDASAGATPTAPGLGGLWLARQIHDAAELDADTPPTSIDGYRIVRELGRGGMGIVYEAMEEEPARRVALKVIHPGLLGPGALRRFRRESRAMAGLRHRGIVQLYAAGSATLTPGGPPRPFLAMELVEGVSLREHVRRERPSIEQRLWLLAQIADAVHHAHQKGVIHRDLKPDNILVHPTTESVGAARELMGTGAMSDGGIGVEPKILDFGVSRLLEGDDTASLRTMDGQIVGTFPYLSPEQAGGDADATDTRSDVYALGVIAFEILSGQAPFDVAGMPARSAVRVVLNEAPKRLRAIEPGVHPDVQTIVHKAMHKDPAARYASAAEFAADLRRFLAFQPILARPPSWGYVASRFVRRHRALSALSAASLAAILVSVVAIVLLWNDARRTREAAVWQSYRSALSAASSAIAAEDIATARRELEASPARHRGWEFRHLFARLDQSRRVMRPGLKPPFSVHVESGERVVLVRAGEMLRVGLESDAAGEVVDAARFFEHAGRCGRPPHFFVDADDPAWRGLLAPLASALAQPEPGQELRRIRCLDLSVSGDGDGGVLAVLLDAGGQHEVLVRRAGEAEARRVAPEPNGQWARIRLSPDGTRLFAASAESDPKPLRVEMIDVETLARLSASQTLGRVVFSLAPLGADRVACVLQSGDLESWELSPGAVSRVARAEYVHDAAENLTLSPDGKVLASASRDGLVRVFDAASLALLYELSGHESEIADVGFTPDSRRIVSTGRDGTVRVWDAARAKPNPLPLRGHAHLVHPLAYAASRGQVVTGSWDRTVAVYDAGTGERLTERTLDNIVLDVVLSPDERMVLTRELGGRVRLMDARTLSDGAAIPEHVRVLDQPAFDRASGLVLLNYDAGRAQVWDIAAGAERTLPGTALEACVGPFLNARAGLIALTENRGGVRTTVLYRYADGVEMMARETTRPAIESVAFSPDLRTMALVETDQRIVLYDTETLRAIGACVGHTREVLGVVFSPDGSRLFSSDLTGAIRVWDTRTWEQVALLSGHESHVRRLIMSPDGRLLISGSRDGTARVWMAP